ncbi:MAG: hypothetical protein HOM58_04525 [Rhodospirillaceae bacterium]|jgi:hypothetical protein|nr:hypothetical protein [Rhodospirillaceae bacterium]MBT5455329.1 hypothetical protein [Rhodospirillaceae bacterium]
MRLHRLWTGHVPLETAFWSYAVFGGILVNALTTGASLILVIQEQPLAALMIGYGPSLPYNLVVTVGVWRAAAHDDVDPGKAERYRALTAVGMLILSVI